MRSYLVILTNDGDARLASTFVLCTFCVCYLRCSHCLFINQRLQDIFSLSRPEPGQTTHQLSTGVTGTTYARFASPFLIIILNAYPHHDDIYAESECKYSEFHCSISCYTVTLSSNLFQCLES